MSLLKYLLLCFVLQTLLSNNISPSQTVHSTRAYGNISLGYYYVNLYIGTPPQRVSVILDTGSGIQAFPCSGCVRCGTKHINSPFKKQASSTYRPVKCDERDSIKMCKTCSQNDSRNKTDCSFSIFYSEGSSLRGGVGEDVIVFSSEIDQFFQARGSMIPGLKNMAIENLLQSEAVRAKFGCIKQQNHLFLNQQADGIFGLNPKRESNLLQKIHEQHSKYTKESLSFSLCFNHNGGWFSIGGASPVVRTSPAVKVAYRDTGGMYSLTLSSIKFGDMDLGYNDFDFLTGSGVFIDSGATYTYMAHAKYSKIEYQLQKICASFDCMEAKGEETKCFTFKNNNTLEQNLKRFPPMRFITSRNQTIYWKSDLYFVLRNKQAQEVCLSILPFGRNILGQSWMAYRDIKFDLERYNVEISDSDCGSGTANTTSMMYEQPKSPLVNTPVVLPMTEETVWIFVILAVVLSVFFAAAIIVYGCIYDENSIRKRQSRQINRAPQTNSELVNISEEKQPGSPVETVISDRIIPEKMELEEQQEKPGIVEIHQGSR